MAFTKKLQAEAMVYFIRTRDEHGRDAHYFLQVETAKETAFIRAMKGKEMVNYASFGEIVARGFGHVPFLDTLALLKHEYSYTPPENL